MDHQIDTQVTGCTFKGAASSCHFSALKSECCSLVPTLQQPIFRCAPLQPELIWFAMQK
jgi:hypothetical protein